MRALMRSPARQTPQADLHAALGARVDANGVRHRDPASRVICERPKCGSYIGIMTKTSTSLAHLSDQALLAEVKRLAVGECQATASLIASLAELDARRLYLAEGCASLFTYCTEVLHLSEHAAYGRIEAARAARRFPLILERLAEGAITLTAVGLLAPHFTADTHQALLDAARHRSKREIERLVAQLHPLPDVPVSVPEAARAEGEWGREPSLVTATQEMLGDEPPKAQAAPPATASTPASVPTPVGRPAVVVPLAPERYKVQVTVGAETYAKLRRAQALLRHAIADGDPAAIFNRALTLLVAELEKTRLAAVTRPRAAGRSAAAAGPHMDRANRSRHIPAAVKRAVWARDGGRCTFVSPRGRCTEEGFLEFHHVVPFAAGGETTEGNVFLRCAMHNRHEAEQYFGAGAARSVREKQTSAFEAQATRSGPS